MRKVFVMLMVTALCVTSAVALPVEEAPKECHIVIQGTYDGKIIDVNVWVTADNCAKAAGELLKEAINKK